MRFFTYTCSLCAMLDCEALIRGQDPDYCVSKTVVLPGPMMLHIGMHDLMLEIHITDPNAYIKYRYAIPGTDRRKKYIIPVSGTVCIFTKNISNHTMYLYHDSDLKCVSYVRLKYEPMDSYQQKIGNMVFTMCQGAHPQLI
jgi:hypothetical protein